ncbi:monovalent cation/H+ antiporter complex subunit F [Pilimelia columellifera]|uniref:monovalent cation/H+ antiporter complex subunit F n=1 Tax=Pilimelia columellifera TaxID=706574 RepID=UPI0031DD4C39
MLLSVGLGLALVRIVHGPTALDRIVALDALLAIAIGAIAVEAAYSKDPTALPALVGLSILGFIGSITFARFHSRSK